MKNINRKKFFISLSTGFLGAVVFRNFNFSALREKTIKDHQVKIKVNPLSVSRTKPGGNNVG